MIVIPKLFSFFNQSHLKRVFTVGLLGVAFFSSPACAAEEAASSPGIICPRPSGIPDSAMFRNLEGINFYLQVPARWVNALNCHGHETDCAAKSSDKEEYAKQLADDYDSYPTPLRPDNLTKLFVQKITEKVSPFVKRKVEDRCQIPPVSVLKLKSSSGTVSTPNTLTVAVKIVFDDQTSSRPSVAVVSVDLYRPDCIAASFATQVLGNGVVSGASIFKLDASIGSINDQLNHLINGSSIGSVRTNKDHEY